MRISPSSLMAGMDHNSWPGLGFHIGFSYFHGRAQSVVVYAYDLASLKPVGPHVGVDVEYTDDLQAIIGMLAVESAVRGDQLGLFETQGASVTWIRRAALGL